MEDGGGDRKEMMDGERKGIWRMGGDRKEMMDGERKGIWRRGGGDRKEMMDGERKGILRMGGKDTEWVWRIGKRKCKGRMEEGKDKEIGIRRRGESKRYEGWGRGRDMEDRRPTQAVSALRLQLIPPPV